MVSWWKPCCISSKLVHLLLLLFSAELICQFSFFISSFIATGIVRGTCCSGCILFSTSGCSFPETKPNVSKASPYFFNFSLFESRSAFAFLFVVFMSCISSFTQSLFTFRLTKFSARLDDADIRGSFFVSATWSCNLVFAWFTSHWLSTMPYGVITDSTYVLSFNLPFLKFLILILG